MLEKTIYLTTLYLSADKAPLVVQVLAALLAAAAAGLVAFRGKPLRIAVLIGLQIPVYWAAAELTTGEWSYLLYKALGPLISALGGGVHTGELTGMLIAYGLPGLAHGVIVTAACLLILRRLAPKRGKSGSRRRR